MFERYTEKARRVIFFARYEASEFGSPNIEAEFLLLGMLREDPYVVTRWLGTGDWQRILREEVAERVPGGKKSPTSVDLPLSDEAKRILAYAAEESGRLKQDHIGTGHLFLGLLRESHSNAAKMLISRGVNINTVRETLAKEDPAYFDLHVAGRSHQADAEAYVIPEAGEPWQILWHSRIPSIGEFLSIDQDGGKSVTYQIVKVEWKVTAISIWPPHLAKVLIHVREFSEENL